jgi:hypothetical protein
MLIQTVILSNLIYFNLKLIEILFKIGLSAQKIFLIRRSINKWLNKLSKFVYSLINIEQ